MTLTELLESVRRVEVRPNRLVNDTMVGAYLSHFKGRGMDFEELRESIPGDDVRDIDWNVTHRLGGHETIPVDACVVNAAASASAQPSSRAIQKKPNGAGSVAVITSTRCS
jgi:hypothetical protein